MYQPLTFEDKQISIKLKCTRDNRFIHVDMVIVSVHVHVN